MPLKLVPPRKGKTPRWYIRGTYLGCYVDQSSGSTERRIARQVLDRLKAEIEAGEFARPDEATFLSAAVAYMEAGGERRFVKPLLDHFKERALSSIDQKAIDDAAMQLYPNASPATRNRQVYTPVSTILKQSGIERKLKRPKGAGGKKITAWLWPEQAFDFFRAADNIDGEFGLFLRVLCYSGLRLSEALNMQISNVRLAESFAFVAKTKNEDPRPVFLPDVVVDALKAHPRGMNRPGEPVFRFHKSGRIYKMFAEACAAAGIPRTERSAFHLFRHTWGSWMRRYAGLDTSGLVGTGAWRDEGSARRYEHTVVSEEAIKAALLPTENGGESVDLNASNEEKRRNGT